MKVFPIKTPVSGEQVVGLHPELKTFTEKDWRRRINNYSGRALTHTALRIEQSGRSGRIATLGQIVSAGVISGLEADKTVMPVRINDEETQQSIILISPGSGLAASGEVVTVNRPLQAIIEEISVYAPVSVLGGAEEAVTEGNPQTEENNSLLARKLGPSLRDAVNSGLAIPRAAVLLMQPVQIEMNLQQGDDPCELDPENYAYENWQLVDGVRLVLYCWPEEVMSLPGDTHAVTWRNRMANSIFSYEKNLQQGQMLPWVNLGVPIGLIGFDENWQALFVDRNAVVRRGGKRKRTASVLPDIGNRFFWQARFDQFNEQLAELVSGAADDVDIISRSASAFRYLPPVGILPKDFIDPRDHSQSFFPLSYHVEAIVVPYEQLDVIVQDSAALESYDFNRPDRVQALIPVPSVYYEPDLLRLEVIDPEFDITIQEFIEIRNDWLGRRLEIRRKASAVNSAVTGEKLEYKFPDPGALDDFELADPFESALIEMGDTWRYFKGFTVSPDNWNSLVFDDSSWAAGASGFGYGNNTDETELGDMQGRYVSVFFRKQFSLNEIDDARNYRLEIVTNGGFYAYINGVEVQADNLADKSFDALSISEAQAQMRIFDLGNLKDELIVGQNILAIQVHSNNVMNPDFTFKPRLVEKRFVADIESEGYSVKIKLDEAEKPVLNDFEPEYEIETLDELKQFFNSLTYEVGETVKPIWSEEEVDKFNSIEKNGLLDFIEFLQDKVNKANDKVDFGFVRLQTDIYRVRQFMLGTVAGTRLATSPVLAGIARGETARATTEQISKVAAVLSAAEKQDNAVGELGAVELLSDPPGSGGAVSRESGGGVVLSAALASGAARDTFVLAEMLSGEAGIALEVDGFADIISAGAERDGSAGDLIAGIDIAAGSTRKQKKTSKIRKGGVGAIEELLVGKPLPVAEDISEQTPIIGTYPSFRNVTVGERLQQPLSEEAITSGRAVKEETLRSVISSGLSLGGIMVPGFKDESSNDIEIAFDQITSEVLGSIREGVHDPARTDDEASSFNASIRAMENASSVLRLIEGRVKTYKVTISRCKKTLSKLNANRVKLDRRLKVIGDELVEARNDVSVSRALKAEELERIDGINARRDAVIDEHVPFLMYRRPRLSDLLIDTPVHTLNPDLSNAPLPVCAADDNETPEEIAAMMDVMKEAPLKWFNISKKILLNINRLSDLRVLFKSANLRARTKTTRHRLLNVRYDGVSKLAKGINKSLLASYEQVALQRKPIAAINFSALNRFGWQETRERANEVISLGDVIDGNHGRMGAGKTAADELDQISRVAICLYLHFTEVLPSLRLDWAERLSQYDAPFNLRNLFSLPRWGELDYIERNEMQRLVDWLYARIVISQTDASNMISDLIRICILLASHAPVGKIVSGLVAEPVTVKVGSRINIIADLSRIRIGMNISMMSGIKVVARGQVADIIAGQVSANIVSTSSSSVLIEKNAKVQISEPRSMGGSPFRRKRFLFRR
ncbi:hypothetical protein MNBD_GAMMA09-499 [hydrothermal vent metagenome]|uniref:Uncharacterized protein n=1 Tax=hydrothermal vent metagenome TaxID=652676 RepID=A0A3B0X4J6_9ZZZZ